MPENLEKLRELTLRMEQAEARNRAILASALDAIISMDEDGVVLDWNPAAETMFGYSRDEAVGKLLADLVIPPAQRAQHRAGLAHWRETGIGPILNKRIELMAQRRSGLEFRVELTVVPIPDLNEFVGFVREVPDHG